MISSSPPQPPLPTPESLIQKICLLQDYILTLEQANQNKYEEIRWQSKLIAQLKQDSSSSLKRPSLSSSLHHSQLQQKLQKYIDYCLGLERENQQLKRRVGELERKLAGWRAERSVEKERVMLANSKDSSNSLRKGIREGIGAKNVTILGSNMSSGRGIRGQTKRSRYSFGDEKVIPVRIQTTPVISLLEKMEIPERYNENERKGSDDSGKSFEFGGGTFSFSNLQEASVQEVVRERTPSKESSPTRNFRKLTIGSYRTDTLRKSRRAD